MLVQLRLLASLAAQLIRSPTQQQQQQQQRQQRQQVNKQSFGWGWVGGGMRARRHRKWKAHEGGQTEEGKAFKREESWCNGKGVLGMSLQKREQQNSLDVCVSKKKGEAEAAAVTYDPL
jgi:hypothetical protein